MGRAQYPTWYGVALFIRSKGGEGTEQKQSRSERNNSLNMLVF